MNKTTDNDFGQFSETHRDSGSMLAEQLDPEGPPEAGMNGKVAVITGGASGIGQAIGFEFARRGASVAFNYLEMPDRDIGELAVLTEATLHSLGVSVYCAPCDVRDSRAVNDFVNTVREVLGGVHYLVNNAGIAHDGALWRMSDESWKEVLDTNVTGAFNCIRAVSSIFRVQRFGKIVNVASHQAHRPGFGVTNYAASKAALVGLTKSAAVELGPSNINVNAVAPGFVRTERLEGLPDEVISGAARVSVLGRLAEPEDISRVIAFLCSEEARHITGQVILVDGGMTLT